MEYKLIDIVGWPLGPVTLDSTPTTEDLFEVAGEQRDVASLVWATKTIRLNYFVPKKYKVFKDGKPYSPMPEIEFTTRPTLFDLVDNQEIDSIATGTWEIWLK